MKTRAMNMRMLLLTILLVAGSGLLFAQEVKSKTTKLRINNLPVEKPKEAVEPEAVEAIPVLPDRQPPVINIITPEMGKEERFQTDSEAFSLIGEVTDESDIRFVSINTEIRTVNESGIFVSDLKLSPGENEIRLVAMDANRNIQEKTIIVEYTPPVVTLADRIQQESTYFGLIIGIDKYRDDALPDLDNPISDARKLQDALIEHYTFSEENIKLLRNPTRGEIIESLDELEQKVSSRDNLLIFFAGHGYWEEEAGIGYWLPSDAELGIKTNWFRNSTLVDYLKQINTRHTLLIADACFGGSIFKTRSVFPEQETAYEKLFELPSRKAMTSGTLTEVPDRSSFTRFLIDRLNNNNEVYLSAEQLFSSFRIAVINNSDAIPKYGEIYNVGDQGGDFIFVHK